MSEGRPTDLWRWRAERPIKPVDIRVLIVAAQPTYRQTLGATFERAGFGRVSGVGDGSSAVAYAERLRPHVVLMETTLPGLSGLDAARQIHRYAPESRVLLMSNGLQEDEIVEGLRAGSRGYLLMGGADGEVVHAVSAVADGLMFFATQLSRRTDIAALLDRAEADDTLDAREHELLRLFADGHTSAEVAALIGATIDAIETECAALMRQLGVRRSSDLGAVYNELAPLSGL
jgi:DNA-binding NarL/FixJ family response regulator